MTTVIACARAGVMVCESKLTSGDMWMPGVKVRRVQGALYGFAGEWKGLTPWVSWLTGGRRGARPKIADALFVLRLDENGVWDMSEPGAPQQIERGFHAIGSGAAAALGAYMAGASPAEAVAIACRIDAGSGGDIVTHSLAGDK